MDHDRLIELRGDVGLIRRTEIAAPLKPGFHLAFAVTFLKQPDRIVVADPVERGLDVFQPGDVTLDGLQIVPAAGHNLLHNVADEVFRQLHDVVQFGISDFRFHHPELCQVAAGLGFLSAECRAKGIHLAQRHGGGFNVKLA